MGAALAAQPRPIQFEICDWGAENVWEWGARVGHSWRLSGDSSATWSYITSIIATNVAVLSYTNFNGHNDMDMMEIGAFNPFHQYFECTYIPVTYQETLSLLNSTQLAIIKNAELLAFHQDANIGNAATPFKATTNAPTTSPPEYYSGASSNGTHVFIINTSSSTATKTFTLSNVPGVGSSGTWKFHDMWARTDLSGTYAASANFSVSVQAHDTVAYLLTQYSASSSGEEWETDSEQTTLSGIPGQLMTKSLLSILKHRTVEKAVERCEMSIVEGQTSPNEEDTQTADDQDELETRLIVRLHCQHGVIKTHRLILLTPASLMAPGIPEVENESNLTIGPRALKDMIEHFPLARGVKSDPQLIWSFGDVEVELRSLASSLDAKGRAQLATELAISAEEFDVYNIVAPTTIAFHLREFNATIAYADSMALPIEFRFSDPAAPLFMDVEGDGSESLFVISTSQVHGAVPGVPSQNYIPPNAKKREREETPLEVRNKKPMKAAQRVDPRAPSVARDSSVSRSGGRVPGSELSLIDPPQQEIEAILLPPQSTSTSSRKEPLFLPSSSQLSVSDQEILRATGLGIEIMGADELSELLEGDGEEVAFDFASQNPSYNNSVDRREDARDEQQESFELEDGAEIPPTQTLDDSKSFQALFDD
ncbi:hypothetical protein H0H93_005837 [Arthromyces matolae]|nr:hypothetical protein H0H93_005837 [Arthromyces matolae]